MSRFITVLILIGAMVTGASQHAWAQSPPFGSLKDVEFSQVLWKALVDSRLAGRRSIGAHPNEGSEPHGDILVTLESTVTVRGREAEVIIKRNYGGDNVSVQSVGTNPRLGLKAVTVMFRREVGYDRRGKDWFWVKYKADGSLHTNPKGMKMAGRISPNETDGCKACHRAAPGDDFVFLHDKYAK